MNLEKHAVKICPRCRHSDPLGASACGSCGHHYPPVDISPPPAPRAPSRAGRNTVGALWLWFIPLIGIGVWQYKSTHHTPRKTLNIGGMWGKPRSVILDRLADFPIVASSAINNPLPPKVATDDTETDMEWETVRLAGGTEVSVVLHKSQLDSVVVRHVRVAHADLDHPAGVFRRFSMTVPTPPDERTRWMAQWDNWHGCRLRLLTRNAGGPVTAMKVDILGGMKVRDDSLAVP